MVFKCQENSFLKEFSSKVVSCEKHESGYNVILEDTILFPEGGGQPSDHGYLNEHFVQNVIRKGGDAIHLIESDEPPFKKGEDIRQKVDWTRRFDHMQQHSGQHLISAVFDNEFKTNTKSWWLGTDASYIELDAKDVSQDRIKLVESICNQLIVDCIAITVKVYDPNDPTLNSDVSRATRGLPEDVTGPLRVVTITGVESNMCCGTHVTNLGQLQMVKLLHLEKAKNKCLLHFLVGNRVLKKLSDCYEREVQMNHILNGGPQSHIDLLMKIQSSFKSSQRISRKLSTEIALREAENLNNFSPPPKYFAVHRTDGSDSDFINTFLRNIKISTCLLFITNGDESGKGQLVLQGNPSDVTTLGTDICTLLDGKGNGKNRRFNAKVTNLKNIPLCQKLIEDHFKS